MTHFCLLMAAPMTWAAGNPAVCLLAGGTGVGVGIWKTGVLVRKLKGSDWNSSMLIPRAHSFPGIGSSSRFFSSIGSSLASCYHLLFS